MTIIMGSEGAGGGAGRAETGGGGAGAAFGFIGGVGTPAAGTAPLLAAAVAPAPGAAPRPTAADIAPVVPGPLFGTAAPVLRRSRFFCFLDRFPASADAGSTAGGVFSVASPSSEDASANSAMACRPTADGGAARSSETTPPWAAVRGKGARGGAVGALRGTYFFSGSLRAMGGVGCGDVGSSFGALSRSFWTKAFKAATDSRNAVSGAGATPAPSLTVSPGSVPTASDGALWSDAPNSDAAVARFVPTASLPAASRANCVIFAMYSRR